MTVNWSNVMSHVRKKEAREAFALLIIDLSIRRWFDLLIRSILRAKDFCYLSTKNEFRSANSCEQDWKSTQRVVEEGNFEKLGKCGIVFPKAPIFSCSNLIFTRNRVLGSRIKSLFWSSLESKFCTEPVYWRHFSLKHFFRAQSNK